MKRLYQFFLLLFILIFIFSFVFFILVSRGLYSLISYTNPPETILLGEIPFHFHAESAGWNALICSAVQFSSLVFLFRAAFRQEKKFSIGMIAGYTTWFLALNLLIYAVIFTWFLLEKSYASLYLLTGPVFSLPHPAWWPFPLVWIALFIFCAEKIKNNPEYGR